MDKSLREHADHQTHPVKEYLIFHGISFGRGILILLPCLLLIWSVSHALGESVMQDPPLTYLLVMSLFVYPPVVIGSFLGSRMLFRYKYYKLSYYLSFLPLVVIGIILLTLFLFMIICAGSFSCPAVMWPV